MESSEASILLAVRATLQTDCDTFHESWEKTVDGDSSCCVGVKEGRFLGLKAAIFELDRALRELGVEQ